MWAKAKRYPYTILMSIWLMVVLTFWGAVLWMLYELVTWLTSK